MPNERRAAFLALFLVFVFFLGLSLSLNLPAILNGFLFADQAVYYAMTQSIAFDGDLVYTRKDLARYYQDFNSGPQGIFLKKGKDGKIFYAKSFAYSLFAAPFVRVFGYHGIFVFHSILLLLMLVMGLAYVSLENRPAVSLLFVLTFLFASVSAVYFFWISPDFFNLALTFFILFLWLYKIKAKEGQGAGEKTSRLSRFLYSESTDYLAAILVGIATFSKPPNAVLMAPLVLFAFFRKKYLKGFLLVFVFILTVGLFFGTNFLLTSDWNYMGGERRTFYFTFPLEKDDVTFESIGSPMTSEGYFERALLPIQYIFFNIFYYFFGRFSGLLWYFFPAVLALILFASGKKRSYQWLILAAITGGILIYIILMPDNYNGGAGGLGNRYFLHIYPLFLFLPAGKILKKDMALAWVFAAVFLSQLLLNPIRSSAFPATHVKKFPYKMLPVELTIHNNISTNTNPNAFRIPFGTPPDQGLVHFLDDNFYPRLEPMGTWTRGHHRAEMILKTYFPVEEIHVHLLNNPRPRNEITVTMEGKTQKVVLDSRQRATLVFPAGKGFRMKYIHLYRMSIKAAKGAIPYYEIRSSDERRFIGVFFELDIIPRK